MMMIMMMMIIIMMVMVMMMIMMMMMMVMMMMMMMMMMITVYGLDPSIFRLTFVATECGESCSMHWKVPEKTSQGLTTVISMMTISIMIRKLIYLRLNLMTMDMTGGRMILPSFLQGKSFFAKF